MQPEVNPRDQVLAQAISFPVERPIDPEGTPCKERTRAMFETNALHHCVQTVTKGWSLNHDKFLQRPPIAPGAVRIQYTIVEMPDWRKLCFSEVSDIASCGQQIKKE
jgi:hypothetical protein